MCSDLPATMAAPRLDCKGPEVARSVTTRSNRGMARRLGLDEAVDLFLDHIKVERGLAKHTIESYGRDLARLTGFLPDRGRADIDDVTPADITDQDRKSTV